MKIFSMEYLVPCLYIHSPLCTRLIYFIAFVAPLQVVPHHRTKTELALLSNPYEAEGAQSGPWGLKIASIIGAQPLSDLHSGTPELPAPEAQRLLGSMQPSVVTAELDAPVSAVPRGEAEPRKLLDSSTAPAPEDAAESAMVALVALVGVLCIEPLSAVKRVLSVHMGRTRVGPLLHSTHPTQSKNRIDGLTCKQLVCYVGGGHIGR